MKKYFISVLFISNYLCAQVPGYMGKKLSVGYRLETSMNNNLIITLFEDVDYGGMRLVNYKGKDVGKINLLFSHNLDAEFVISKRVSLRGMFGLSRRGVFGYVHPTDRNSTGMYEPDFMQIEYPKLSSYFDIPPDGSAPTSEYYDEKNYDYTTTHSQTFKVGLSISKNLYYSPHGVTNSFYFIQNLATAHYIHNGVSTPFTKVTSYGCAYEISKRTIVVNCLILEYGCSFNALFGGSMSGTSAQFFTSTELSRMFLQVNFAVRYLVPKLTK